jgi:hypothetical protein
LLCFSIENGVFAQPVLLPGARMFPFGTVRKLTQVSDEAPMNHNELSATQWEMRRERRTRLRIVNQQEVLAQLLVQQSAGPPGRVELMGSRIGDADAEATRIYGEACDAGPEFYYFFRTLDSYDAFGDNTTLMMDAESDFFRCFQTAVQP